MRNSRIEQKFWVIVCELIQGGLQSHSSPLHLHWSQKRKMKNFLEKRCNSITSMYKWIFIRYFCKKYSWFLCWKFFPLFVGAETNTLVPLRNTLLTKKKKKVNKITLSALSDEGGTKADHKWKEVDARTGPSSPPPRRSQPSASHGPRARVWRQWTGSDRRFWLGDCHRNRKIIKDFGRTFTSELFLDNNYKDSYKNFTEDTLFDNFRSLCHFGCLTLSQAKK